MWSYPFLWWHPQSLYSSALNLLCYEFRLELPCKRFLLLFCESFSRYSTFHHFLPFLIRIPIWDNRCCLLKLQIRSIVLLMGAISLAACWVVYRKESFSWILQDILGICFRYYLSSFQLNHNLNIFSEIEVSTWSVRCDCQVLRSSHSS